MRNFEPIDGNEIMQLFNLGQFHGRKIKSAIKDAILRCNLNEYEAAHQFLLKAEELGVAHFRESDKDNKEVFLINY